MTDSATKRRPSGLGRGLSALLGDVQREEPVAPVAQRTEGVQTVAVASIRPNPDQPRRQFDEAALQELSASIASRGLIQPIVVRPLASGGYQLVAGERRWRAAQLAQLHEIPAIVRELDDAQTLEIALLENIQREDLNAIEEAEAYARLIREYHHTQEELGRIVAKSRSHVSNLLRLLDLPEEVRRSVAEGQLSMGHARALITASDPSDLANQVVKRGLSVRDTERLARSARPQLVRRVSAPRAKERDEDLAALERQLGDVLGLKVSIAHRDGGGTVTLSYSSLDQLDMICQRLTGERI